MTREEAIEIFKNMLDAWDNYYTIAQSDKKREAVELAISSLETDEAYQLEYERTTKDDLAVDCISRKAVLDAIDSKAWEFCDYLISKGRNDEQKPVSHFADNLRECVSEELPSITPQEPRWIPVSERLPEPYMFVNATCRSLVDDREDWVVETIYSPIPKEVNEHGYSDWGNIPMLNWGEAEVIAWVERIIPQPYKAESEG